MVRTPQRLRVRLLTVQPSIEPISAPPVTTSIESCDQFFKPHRRLARKCRDFPGSGVAIIGIGPSRIDLQASRYAR